MRYRPFGGSGRIVSALTIQLSDTPSRPRAGDWTALIFAALEHGINSFEVSGHAPALTDGLAEALAAVERRLVFVSWRLGARAGPTGVVRDFSAAHLHHTIEAALARTGLEYLDLVMLDDPGVTELPAEALEALKALRAAGAVQNLGVAGQGEAMDAYISTGAFDVLATPYNLVSGWRERHRLNAAAGRDMPVIGYDYHPEAFHRAQSAAAVVARSSLWGRARPASPLAGAGTYAFLDRTEGWTGEEICLAYALTEPALASIQISTAAASTRLEALAAVTERELPPGLAAQIEMARFSAGAEPAAALRKA